MRITTKLILFALLLLGASFLLFSEQWYRALDRSWMATRHLNQFVHYSLGWQLPGTPDLTALDERLQSKGLKRGAPVFLRIFKADMELEVWMKSGDRFVHFATYPMCYWSGQIGPKQRTGDHQAPEGFYTVSRGQLNPNSRWYRSFNLGYPNLFDRAHGRTGSYLMVHGGCSSVGCYAMTNGVVREIWDLINAAFDAGQQRFAVHAFPFRLTEGRLDAYKDHRWAAFWQDLKPAYDLFEATNVPPQISVCAKRYQVEPGKPGDASAPELRSACPQSRPSA